MARIEQTDSVFYFSISVPYTQCEALYSPSVPNVVMVAESGVRVQVPTGRLRQFITSDMPHSQQKIYSLLLPCCVNTPSLL